MAALTAGKEHTEFKKPMIWSGCITLRPKMNSVNPNNNNNNDNNNKTSNNNGQQQQQQPLQRNPRPANQIICIDAVNRQETVPIINQNTNTHFSDVNRKENTRFNQTRMMLTAHVAYITNEGKNEADTLIPS